MKMHHPTLDAAIPKLYEFVRNFMNPKEPGGLYVLFGTNGCGKTHIAKALIRIFKSNRMTIGPVVTANGSTDVEGESGVNIADCLSCHWPTAVDNMKRNEWQVFEDLRHEYLVVIDDIGAEHDPSGVGLEKLYVILNHREFKRTLVTTNFGPEQWEAKFEKRIASRMFRHATHIDLSGVPDYSTL